MGIDVYMSWDGISKAEKDAQYTGFSVESGEIGYLREAYHGSPYATKVLLHETWDGDTRWAGAEVGKPADPRVVREVIHVKDAEYGDYDEITYHYPAEVLRERLPAAIAAAIERERSIYKNPDAGEDSPVVQAFVQFVELAERKERETGKPVQIINSY